MREEFLDYMKNDCPLCMFLGIEPLECKAGYSKVKMPLADNQVNGLGIAHGGALFTLADMAMVLTIIGGGNICVTLNSNVSYLNPAKAGPLMAEAFLTSESKKIAHIEVNIKDAEETLVCRCSFIAYKKPAVIPELFKK
jgi:acyl-CoA thioesterase